MNPQAHDNFGQGPILDELAELLPLIVERRADESQRARLNALLLNNPEAHRFYLQYMDMHAALSDPGGSLLAADEGATEMPDVMGEVIREALAQRKRQEIEDESQRRLKISIAQEQASHPAARSAENPKRVYIIPRPLFWGGLVAAMVLLAVLLWPSFSAPAVSPLAGGAPEDKLAPADPVLVPESAPVGVATLTGTVGAVWADGQSRAAGQSLEPGRTLILSKGLARLTFDSGAELIVEAPASFTLDSASRVSLHDGKVVGRCDTPSSKGFVVRTPSAHITDLGTEFGIHLGNDGFTRVCVFEGVVQVNRIVNEVLQDGSPVSLHRGQAAQINPTGSQVSLLDSRFSKQLLRSDEFNANALAASSAYHRWLAYSYELRRDPDLVAYYLFSPDASDPTRLPNLATGDSKASDGIISGPFVVPGRFSQGSALRYGVDNDTIRLDVPGTTRQLTLVMWMRLDRLDLKMMTGLLMSTDWGIGELLHQRLHLQLNENGTSGNGVLRKNWTSAEPVIRGSDLDRWIQYAVVIDLDRHQQTEYLDGKRVSQIDSLPADIPGIALGPCELGSWDDPRYPNTDTRNGIRSMRGDIDEFALFYRALTEEEITASYQAGKAR